MLYGDAIHKSRSWEPVTEMCLLQIQQVKLTWNAKSKVGSLENATHKPGGGDKKIESVKLDFKEKAKPKIGSKDNVKHQPGGGVVKVCIFERLTDWELGVGNCADISSDSRFGSSPKLNW